MPSARTVPASGASSPASSLTVVLLPAPLGPAQATISPRRTRRSTPRRASITRTRGRTSPTSASRRRSVRWRWRYRFQTPVSSTAVSEVGVSSRAGSLIVSETSAEQEERRRAEHGRGGGGQQRARRQRRGHAQQGAARDPGDQADREDGEQRGL